MVGFLLAIVIAMRSGLPGAVAARPPAGLVVPVLMYHHLADPSGPVDRSVLRFMVSPSAFAGQLDYLKANGYHTIDTRQMDAAVRQGAALPSKPVMVTFDDGWAEQYSIAFPMLRQRGMVGVFFVHTGVIGEKPGAYMSWDQVCGLQEGGMDVESHTVSHASLPGLDDSRLEMELRTARSTLERMLGRPVLAFAYPFGDYREREMTAAGRAGYDIAFTTEVGLVQNRRSPYELHRTIVTYFDSLSDLEIKLTEAGGERALLDYRQSITP